MNRSATPKPANAKRSLYQPLLTLILGGLIGAALIATAQDIAADKLTLAPKSQYSGGGRVLAGLAASLGINGSIAFAVALLVPGLVWTTLRVLSNRRQE